MMTATSENNPQYVLDRLKSDLSSNVPLLSIQAQLQLTKTERALSVATLLRDLDLEAHVRSWIESRVGSLQNAMSRYQSYDPKMVSLEIPKHFAVHVLKGVGSICSGKNIFLFFPECLGLKATSSEETFGLELIDIWQNVFDKVVFPCLGQLTDEQTHLVPTMHLWPKLRQTIYLASIFHEVGHRVGPYQVSPQTLKGLNIPNFQLDVLGELATDSMLVSFFPEFPELAQFVLLQRLFWFPRRGFTENPVSAWSNRDNDSWIGLYLWNQLESQGVVSWRERRLEMNWARVREGFTNILEDIDLLGAQLLDVENAEAQAQKVQEWMRTRVKADSEGNFILPQALQEMYQVCQNIPEIPHFSPRITSNLGTGSMMEFLKSHGRIA